MGKERFSSVFFGGIPTNIDVEKIENEIGIPKKGDLIHYEVFEKITNLKKSETRFTTVVDAWRKKIYKENNLLTEASRGIGIVVLDDNRRVDHCSRKLKNNVKAVSKSYSIAATTPRNDLEPNQIRHLDHVMVLSSALLKTTQKPSIEYKDNLKKEINNG